MTDVRIHTEGRIGRIGRIRLDRPQALHALTTGMCRAISAALDAWRDDPAVEAVLIDHAEGRGFCAGGDVRAAARSAAGDGQAARAFFFDEYRMNHRLFTWPKPLVAFLDGVTMGGGVGLSLPARFRVATEHTRFAMPEAAIGLFPDVGGGWYLPRLPGRLGVYLALTGHRLDGADCIAVGIATHYLPADRLDAAKARIAAAPDAIDAVLGALAVPSPDAAIVRDRPAIDRCFASDALGDIVAALHAEGGAWAERQCAALRAASPQALKLSLRLLREGRARGSFAEEMRHEYALVCRVLDRPDFVEGVRALLVDKDRAPRWNPPTPEAVDDALLDALFAPLPDDAAWTP